MTKEDIINYLRGMERCLNDELDRAVKTYGCEDEYTDRILTRWAVLRNILDDLKIG